MLPRRNNKAITKLWYVNIIAIVIILTALKFSVPTSGSVEGGGDGQLARLREIETAIDRYHADNGRYPRTLDELASGTRPYLLKVPEDPATGAADWEVREKFPNDGWYRNQLAPADYTYAPARTWRPEQASGIFDVRPRPAAGVSR